MPQIPNNLIRGLLVLSCLAASAAGLMAPLHAHVTSHDTAAHEGCGSHDSDHNAPSETPGQTDADHCHTCFKISQATHTVVPPLGITIEHAAEPADLVHFTDQAPHVRSHESPSSPRAPPTA